MDMHGGSKPSVSFRALALGIGVSLAAHAVGAFLLARWTLHAGEEKLSRVQVKLLSVPPQEERSPQRPRSDLQLRARPIPPSRTVSSERRKRDPAFPAPAAERDAPALVSLPEKTVSPRLRPPAWSDPAGEEGPLRLERTVPTAWDPSKKEGTGGLDDAARSELEGYLALIHERIRGHVFYPGSARSRGLQGTAVLLITLAKNGALVAVEILSTSGHRGLDRAAMTAVQRAAPFPACPVPSYEQIQFSIPLVYRLE